MRRKIKHTKRYKDYPKNVPKRLLKLFFELNRSVSRLAMNRGVNSGTLSTLLNDGHEPKDNIIRLKLFLSENHICRSCGRRTVIKSDKPKQSKPDFIIQWDHLPKEERHKVIQEYLTWRLNNRK